MDDAVNPTSASAVAIYRPKRRKGLPQKAHRHIGDPVVQVIIQIGDHVLDPPLGYAVFSDGDTVLAGPADLEHWDGTFTVHRPARQSRR